MARCFIKIIAFVLCCIPVIFSLNSCSKSNSEQGKEDWSFIVFSDIQQGYGVYSQIAQNTGNITPIPKISICCGDVMLRSANEVEWLNFWHNSRPITDKMQLLLARGNHEGNDKSSEEMLRKQFSFPNNNFYMAQQVDNTCFVLLDTEKKDEEGSIGLEQFTWLQNILEKLSYDQSVDHIFLFMHRPMFPQGKYLNSPLSNSDELHQLFLNNPKIRSVFSGHEHMFHKNRKDGLTYITSGGGGGILYHGYGGDYHHFTKVSFYKLENRINIQTIGLFNEVVEDFNL